MFILILLLTGAILSIIAYQDLKTRSVSWFLFPLLAASGAGLAFSELQSPGLLLLYTAINGLFLLLQFALLKMWLFIKNRRNTVLIDHAIGKGDLLFLLATCCFFPPVNFILFYLLSLVFSLLLYLLIRRWPAVSGNFTTVPLAGLQAGFLIFWMLLKLT
jgi:hypothetical protein